ncbi:MAG: SDR family NAD(P)-dependent oxidoreductase [Phycisphaerales bacterium]|nr:SDR family NAD(P)-dependent oxidoreductase [Phycisphaerales bacterium]
MSYDLLDKVVFITGASSGIGAACAEAFATAGARVVAAARRIDLLNELARRLGDDRVMPVALDVTDAAQREAGVRAAEERFGPVDVLINNAGWASFGAVADMPLANVRAMLELNVLAPVALCKLVLPRMLERRGGQIINIASVVGYQPIPRMTAYSATKAFVLNFSAGLRMELHGAGVDVISVAPGSTRTPFFENAASVNVRAVRLARTQYSPQRVARAVVKASRRRRREVVLSAEGNTIALIRRASHRLADAIMVRFARFAMPPGGPGDRSPGGIKNRSPVEDRGT